MEAKDDLPDPGGIGGLLAHPNRVQEDCNLIRRAINEGWPVPMERRQRILTTLQQIVETDTFEIEKVELVKSGEGQTIREETVQKIRGPNHANQIKAAKVVLDAFKTNEADRHHVEDHNQRERHHVDDVARGAGENKTVNQTIVLMGADEERLKMGPKRAVP